MYPTFRKTLTGIVGAVLISAAAILPAAAQESFSDEHIAAAREAVGASNAIRPFDDVLPIIAERTRTLFIRNDPANTVVIDEVVNAVALSLAERRPELNRIVYEVWARRFTVEELQQLASFYKSPLGQKYAKVEPELRALSIGAAKQWGDAISTEMVTLVREELTKRMSGGEEAPAKQ
ncbi:DUF2059 domain-containing protein [Stappia sp.]|jgi:hypothetical protein|uniref:DUF2059 domain-containing protein n=1 Tax=Stappia sp. TaxID=1870903 RepID=UPI003A9A5CB8